MEIWALLELKKAFNQYNDVQTIVDIMHRLTHEVSIQTFVANELLLPTPKEEISGMLMKQEDAHFMSIQLNLFNTFLYMVLFTDDPEMEEICIIQCHVNHI